MLGYKGGVYGFAALVT